MSKKPKQQSLFATAQPAVPVVRNRYTYSIPHPNADDGEAPIKVGSLDKAYREMIANYYNDLESDVPTPSKTEFEESLKAVGYYEIGDFLRVNRTEI
ncbi:hypothetical protein [Pedobacter sp. CFBP9032]|uniref:hypothetical protein n=1 Tax=Pedobacter sp. CFBP9032 TaxID=3096539 RepID=UPI002A6B3E14|nr:hypothetical protein [Pedobacter sp. CFBP9032]MDY0906600.1 hypothetical protein [Pedobacter sp. CFBP9032]